MKKILTSLLVVLFLLLPVAASAATVAELQTKLQLLLLQVDQVRQDLAAAQAAAASSASTSSGRTALCVELTRMLSLGASDATTGGEVSALQKVLAQDPVIYPEGRVTGYYGPATEAAVKLLQTREGVVAGGNPATTGFGAVGALTRAFFLKKCGTTMSSGSASSTSSGTSGGATTPPSTLTNALQAALPTITLDVFPTATTNTPTVSGTAKNLTSVSVSLRSSETVYESSSVSVQNGVWSVKTSPVKNGTYQVIVRGGGGGAVAVGFITVDVPDTSGTSAASTTPVTKPAIPHVDSEVQLKVNGSDRGTTVTEGSRVLVGWSTKNVSSCVFASNPAIELSGTVLTNESGKSTSPISKTSVFTITCTATDGVFVSDSLTVTVMPRN